MTKLLLFGAGGHAKVIADIIEQNSGKFEIIGVVDDNKTSGTWFGGYPLVGWKGFLDSDVKAGLVCVGDNWTRYQFVKRILSARPGFTFANVIHPRAIVSRHVTFGQGNVVMAGAVLNPGTVVKDHTIINTGASVDHDAFLDDYSSLGPGVILGGNCQLGKFCAVGIGATVFHRIKLGAHSIIGGGAVVTREIPDYCVSFGVPAHPVRQRKEGEPYL